jgi:hypothetical protein
MATEILWLSSTDLVTEDKSLKISYPSARVMQISQIAQKFFTQFLCRYFKPSREFFVGRT